MKSTKIRADGGSFRDPGGHVYDIDGRIFRTVLRSAAEDFEFTESTGLIKELIDDGLLVGQHTVARDILGGLASDAVHVIEHSRIPFISYPYEWPFPALKDAAVAHLDVHLRALKHDVNLSDASAYNIQFQGVNPVFIDRLSFRRYREGEYWIGHRQFCEQFLNPLLLRAHLGIPHNSWYRGTQEGITSTELNAILPVMRKYSWNVLTHVVLQSSFQKSTLKKGSSSLNLDKKLPKAAIERMLMGLRKWIEKLEPADTGRTVWGGYAADNTYSDEERSDKRSFIGEFVRETQPSMVWDIGCNTGDYSVAALDAGAQSVIGFDFDQHALEIGYARAKNEGLNFLPLFLDATNPAPAQGWAEKERKGLKERSCADGILALALVHHLAIARNIPLAAVVDWLVGFAPTGVIEFVQKSDPMVEELLRLREDIFPDYNEEHFSDCLGRHARIVKTDTVSETGRRLFRYERL